MTTGLAADEKDIWWLLGFGCVGDVICGFFGVFFRRGGIVGHWDRNVPLCGSGKDSAFSFG